METPKPSDQSIPKRIDRYDLVERIGAGGMGLIFKGIDTKLKRPVAIKIVSDRVKDASVRATIRERFFNEARAAGGLSHPNLVQIYDFNEENGLAYIVMEYIEGETLEDLIKSKGPVNNEELTRIGKEIASGLAFAHRKGIVHRDIKPSNIILEAQSGLSKILDFGIAKFVNEDEMKLTSTGMVLGSTHYLSPEHIVGKNLDGRSDIFCMGTLMYEAATGVLPFRGQNSSTILYKIVHFDPQSPIELRPGLSPLLADIILKCLKKNAAERFQKCEDLEKELEALQGKLRGDTRSSGSEKTPSQVAKAFFARDSQIISALQAQKKITPQQASELRGKNVSEAILRDEIISEDDLSKVISECLTLPWISRGRLKGLRVQKDAVATLPQEIIRKHNVLPFFLDPQKKLLSVVIDGTQDFQKEEAFADLAGSYALNFYISGRSTIRRLIEIQFDTQTVPTKSGIVGADTHEQSAGERYELRRVLLIDSTPHYQEALVKLFKGYEQNLVLCTTAEEAILKIKRDPFDFVWANRNVIGDELQFESLILKQNPTSDIRYFENLPQELFQETVHYRRFKEFFHRLIQSFLVQQKKENRRIAEATADFAVKAAQSVTQLPRQLDEVYYSVLLWKLDKLANQMGKAFDAFDGIFRMRYIYDTIGERFDGRGTSGLREDQIPLASRVIAALLPLEVFGGFEKQWTIEEITDLRGKYAQYNAKQLDPRLTTAVLDLISPAQTDERKGKIAIIDSDEAFANRLASQLKQFSMDAAVYTDGITALVGIKKNRPDLIISEVLVSKLDGFSLCARLRSDENLKNIPLVFLSDSTAPEHSTKALQLGAEDFLQKTQDSQFIMTKLERMLKKLA